MRWSRSIVVLAVFSVLAAGACSQQVQYPPANLAYPKAQQVAQVDDYHGTKVADPYRWMEKSDDPALAQWIEAENKITFGYLEQIPARERIRQLLTKLWNFERFTPPFKEGGRYFYSKNNGLQNQNVIYTVATLEGTPELLLDPNTFSKDGTVSLGEYSISDDGRYMAYSMSDGGSDWRTIKVRDVGTKQDLADEVKWVKFSSPSWTKDSKGFFYSRYDEPPAGKQLQEANYFQKLYYHRLGTPQSTDELVYQRPDQKEWGFGGSVSEDGRYLIISVWKGTERKNRLYYKDLQAGGPVVELLNDFDAEYDFVENDGTVFYVKTDLNAPRGRLIAMDLSRPDRSNWKEIIPQSGDTLQGLSLVNNTFVASYLKDAYTHIGVYQLDGALLRQVKLPGLGTASGFGGKRRDTETFYSYASYTTPGTVYRYDLVADKSTVFRAPKVDFKPDAYTTEQVFYTSKDGTRIPMFLSYRKGLQRNGRNPTLLYGYGGFNVPLTPTFSVSNLVWMEMGGVYAVANLRGGGEYGKEWHDAGRLKNKQNVFDDFIAAGEWLIANKYTHSQQLAIMGGSNGGLLVGACMTQRPDLFAAALPAVGVMDMLRFHKFTIGWGWTSDFGCSENTEDFKALYAYSPLHNLKPGVKYPATLVTTADRDDRVVPAHSFKFAAKLQECQAGEAPVLIRIETRAGHGAGKPTSKLIAEAADRWAFLVRVLGIPMSSIPS